MGRMVKVIILLICCVLTFNPVYGKDVANPYMHILEERCKELINTKVGASQSYFIYSKIRKDTPPEDAGQDFMILFPTGNDSFYIELYKLGSDGFVIEDVIHSDDIKESLTYSQVYNAYKSYFGSNKIKIDYNECDTLIATPDKPLELDFLYSHYNGVDNGIALFPVHASYPKDDQLIISKKQANMKMLDEILFDFSAYVEPLAKACREQPLSAHAFLSNIGYYQKIANPWLKAFEDRCKELIETKVGTSKSYAIFTSALSVTDPRATKELKDFAILFPTGNKSFYVELYTHDRDEFSLKEIIYSDSIDYSPKYKYLDKAYDYFDNIKDIIDYNKSDTLIVTALTPGSTGTVDFIYSHYNGVENGIYVYPRRIFEVDTERFDAIKSGEGYNIHVIWTGLLPFFCVLERCLNK